MNLLYLLFFINTTLTTDNACMDVADQTIWKNGGQSNFRTYMNTCGSQCIGNYDCTVKCVKAQQNYTDDCCSCFGNLGECSVKNCLTKCLGGDTPSCEECISVSCDGDFHICSGLDVPPPKKKDKFN